MGRIFSTSLAKRGFSLIVHYHQSAELAIQTARILEPTGVPVQLMKADLTREDDIIEFFKEIDQYLLQQDVVLQVMVNSAAIMISTPPKEVTYNAWDTVMNLNSRAPFFLAVNAAKRMVKGGVIINISDVASNKLWTNYSVYIASKSILEVLTRILAKDLAPNIRVNALAPGLVLPQEGMSNKEWQTLVSRLPLQKAVTEKDLAESFLFLLDNESITGQTLVLDGGYSLVT